MRFLVDECTGPLVARWLREQKHEVFSVYEEGRGMEDNDIECYTEARPQNGLRRERSVERFIKKPYNQ